MYGSTVIASEVVAGLADGRAKVRAAVRFVGRSIATKESGIVPCNVLLALWSVSVSAIRCPTIAEWGAPIPAQPRRLLSNLNADIISLGAVELRFLHEYCGDEWLEVVRDLVSRADDKDRQECWL